MEEKSRFEKIYSTILSGLPTALAGFACLMVGETVLGIIIIVGTYVLMYVVYKIFEFILRDYTSIEYKIEKIKNKDGLIYIRDVDSPLSPASVSYLINKEINIKKDIIADILSLISKKALSIGPDLELIPSDIKLNLTKDEKYIYDWFISSDNIINIDAFTDIIKEETQDYVKVRKNVIEWIHKILVCYFILAISISSISYEFGIRSNFLYNTIFPCVILLAVILVNIDLCLIRFSAFVSSKVQNKEYFTYTKKGINEMINLSRFKKFIEDFGILDEVKLESIVLWNKYLAYAVALNVNTEYRKININDIGSKFPTTMNGITIDYTHMDKFIEARIGSRLL